jgi:hypothetical protein
VTDDNDPKAKDVIDAATAAELERWFGLPSFQELADKGVETPEDPDVARVREQREKALAAIDPALVEAHRRRTDPPDDLIRFKPLIDVRVDPSVARLDLSMIDRQHTIAEPREVEISEELRDDLKECTPQALLRDLHRAEIDFDKTFEIVDAAAAQRLDIVAEVADAMRTSWKLPPLGALPFTEARETLAELRAERRQPWAELFARTPLPNRRWARGADK